MSTPLPGQIRCPTCHRSTDPAAFCTQCGTAIPDSARARPRGLDREELQDRIRTHRPGDAAFRRGSQVGGDPDQGPSAYRPYQPEPEDELVLPGGATDEGEAARIDNTSPGFDEPPPLVVPSPPLVVPPPVTPMPVAPPEAAQVEPPVVEPRAAERPAEVTPAPSAKVAKGPPRREPQPAPWKPAPPPPPIEPFEAPPSQWSGPDEPYLAAAPGEADAHYRNPRDPRDRGSGIGPLAIGGFVLLGVLAIGVGAFMAGLFSGGAPVGSPSPTPLASTFPSASLEASLPPSTAPSVPASLGPTATPGPILDGFTARTEPCAEQPNKSPDGCGSSAATIGQDPIWVWVGWQKGTGADTLGVTIEDDAGAPVSHATLSLSTIGAKHCLPECSGYLWFKFQPFDPGNYTIRLDRNGVSVAEATFTVNS